MESLSNERISWVKPENYHITLRFIGDTKASAIKGIGRKLLEGVRVPEKFELRFSQLDSFGPRKKPRVIWLGLTEPVEIENLKADVDKALEASGMAVGQEVFRAHLTLGRVRGLKEPGDFHDQLKAMRERFEEEVRFDKLVFFRSELGIGGPVYSALYEIPFK